MRSCRTALNDVNSRVSNIIVSNCAGFGLADGDGTGAVGALGLGVANVADFIDSVVAFVEVNICTGAFGAGKVSYRGRVTSNGHCEVAGSTSAAVVINHVLDDS